jgi:DivIVA domain-containing protein
MSTASSPHVWRPDDIRSKQFTVRMRGVDTNEVRGFLNLLADDVQRLQEQVATYKRDYSRQRDSLEQAQDELAQSRAELQEVRNEMQRNPHGEVTEQAVELLNQAQQLADALIDESMQAARDMMTAARSHQREVVVSPVEDRPSAALPGAEGSDHPDDLDAVSSVEDGGVRPTARVTQAQFRAVLDALNEQINRLGTMTDRDATDAPADLAAARSGAANGRNA